VTRKGDWIQTYTGRMFWPEDPRAAEINIVDIAHALANICRFGGHCCEFYSVAQHSLEVAALVGEEDRLAALLHDAAEAYIGDMVRPIKRRMARFSEMERGIHTVICERYGLSPDMPKSVKEADEIMLATEAKWLMVAAPAPWALTASPRSGSLVLMRPKEAEAAFLNGWQSGRAP